MVLVLAGGPGASLRFESIVLEHIVLIFFESIFLQKPF